jgi:phenylacetate-coenzyme A ligase PaaK-like adenylate-forming protein
MTATPTATGLPELMARDAWSRDELLAHQRDRLRALLEHAVAHSPYYRDVLGPGAADAPLEALPTLTKATLMEQWDRVCCEPELTLAGIEAHVDGPRAAELHRGRYRIASTSGATGLRGLFAYDRDDFAVWALACLRATARLGLRPGDRIVSVAAHDPVHISRHIYAELRAGGPPGPQLHALMPTDELVAGLNAARPESLMGYASVIGLLADEQLCGRLRIAPRVIGCSSEPLTHDIRTRVRRAWGSEPANVYASTEAFLVGASTPATPDALEIADDLLIVEVVDADGRPVPDGEVGEKLLLTNLGNFTLPLIRYELADRVARGAGPNPSGRPYAWLHAVEGRASDTLRLPGRSGGRVSVLPYRLGEPFAHLPDVRQFQIDWDGARMTIRVVLRTTAPADTPARVRDAVATTLRQAGAAPVPIAVERAAALEREPGPAGKLKLIRSTA